MNADRDVRIAILSHLDALPESQSMQPPAIAKTLDLTGEQVNAFLSAAANRGEVETLRDGSVRIHQRLRGQFSGYSPVHEPTKVQFAGKGGVNIIISQSNIGLLNTGELEDVKSISVNITSLQNSGYAEVAEALKNLTEAVVNSQELSSEKQSEVLDQLTELSRWATLTAEQRAKPGVLKAVLGGLATTLGAAGGLAEVWSTWGPAIRAFFGL